MSNGISRGLVFASEVSTGVMPDIATTLDRSRQRNSGVNTAITYQRAIGGVAGTSLGSGPFVHAKSAANSSIQLTTDCVAKRACTIKAWVKIASSIANSRILSNSKAVFRVPTVSSLLNFSSNGNADIAVGVTPLKFNVWYMVAVTRTAAGVANIYLNGKLDGAANQVSGAPVTGTSNLTWGNEAAAAALVGNMANMVIYAPNILTPGQILNLFESERRLFGV